MLTLTSLAVVAATLLACAALSPGAPVEFNGEADGPAPAGSYFRVVDDPIEGVFESPSWDVARLVFYPSMPALLIIVETVGPFDRNGGDTSLTGTTLFAAVFTDASGSRSQMIEVTLTETTAELRIDGVPVEEGPLPWEQWGAGLFEGKLAITLGRAFLDASYFSWGPGFGIRARLDDCDAGADDVIVGWVPEPTGLALLALGAAALLRRRGRPRAL